MTDVEVRKAIPLRNVPGVELAAIGTWAASTGVTTFTPEDLANAVSALECPGVRNPVIKLGHDEPDSTSGVRWDGEPAVGWIGNMRMDGAKLIGDYMGMPEWLASVNEYGMAVLATAYPDRSIEIRRPFVCQIGHAHPSVITAVSLLGVNAPGVGVLKSMQDVYAAFTEPLSADVARAGAQMIRTSVNVNRSSLNTSVRLASRELTEVEQRSGTDFAAAQSGWEDALDDLLDEWSDVQDEQYEALSEQVSAAVDSDPDRLGELVLDAAVGAALLFDRMRALADQAMAEQIMAAAEQGVIITSPGVDDDELREIADAVAGAMAASTASTAGRTAAQNLGTGDGKTIAAGVISFLTGLTDRFLRDQLGGALSAAQSIARFRVLEVAPIGEWYASEVNDSRTCKPCKSIDGKKFDDLDSARAAYGSGKYTGCSGGGRCRGQVIATWGTALSAPIRTTVRMSLGGTMPDRPGGAVQASVSVEDISRQYYESAGYSMWITAMHVDPLELIASDDSTSKFYRIPVELSGEQFTFGEPSEVAINYVEVPVAAKALPYRWGTKAAALLAAGKAEDGADLKLPTNVTTEPGKAPDGGAAIRKLAATTATEAPDDATAPAGSITNPEEASGMAVDESKLREALGLAADAPIPDAVLAAVSPPTTEATTNTGGTDAASLLAAIPAGSGAIVLDGDNYKALLASASKGEMAFQAMQDGQRDSVLEQAAREGRFPVVKLADYKDMWDKNPDATREFIKLMPKNSVPTMSVGFLGAEVNKNESDMAYDAMYPQKAGS